MKRDARIYLAGHRGLVGSAIFRRLEAKGFYNIITRGHDELDLTNQQAVNDFLAELKPHYVVLAAAKVGGIYANNTYSADFIYQNLMIEANVINAAYRQGVEGLLFLGSSCIYPRLAKQPMTDCESYNRQYGTNYRSAMPTNGANDNRWSTTNGNLVLVRGINRDLSMVFGAFRRSS